MTRMRTLVAGHACGPVLKLQGPLSLWGGVDLRTGEIVDQSHPQSGTTINNCVLTMSMARGSSSSSSALVELARAGAGPCAIILGQYDPILVVGALVAARLYRAALPVILAPTEDLDELASGIHVSVDALEEQVILTRL